MLAWRAEGMLPTLPALEIGDRFLEVQVPCPDISIGIRRELLLEKLQLRDGGPEERILPTSLELQDLLFPVDGKEQPPAVYFPFLTIEAKPYAAGGTLFEAQNQAAVSGCYMTHMQERVVKISQRYHPLWHTRHPLAFSICTEGPQMELWAHYMNTECGERVYRMSMLQTCNVAFQETVTDFLATVSAILTWGGFTLWPDIAKQLAKVEESACCVQAAIEEYNASRREAAAN